MSKQLWKGVTSLSKKVKTADLYSCTTSFLQELFAESEYPWEMLPKLKPLIQKLLESGLPGFSEFSSGVFVGEGVTVAATATILPPAIIGAGTEIRPGAYLRGNVIVGEKCVIGNSTEMKHCLLLDGVQVPHYNYVGDSVLGNRAHMGAGTVCSNLKADGKNVVIHGDKEYETGLRKIGAFLADGADVGCNCVLNPGTVVGKGTTVYPLTSLRGVVPENSIVKALDNIVTKY